MKRSVFLLLLSAASVAAAPVAAEPNVRADIEAFLDTRGLPAGADRACVVDHAIEAHPNVPLALVGPPLSGAARKQHEENVRRIKVALAVKAATEACVPAATQEEVVDGQP